MTSWRSFGDQTCRIYGFYGTFRLIFMVNGGECTICSNIYIHMWILWERFKDSDFLVSFFIRMVTSMIFGKMAAEI